VVRQLSLISCFLFQYVHDSTRPLGSLPVVYSLPLISLLFPWVSALPLPPFWFRTVLSSLPVRLLRLIPRVPFFAPHAPPQPPILASDRLRWLCGATLYPGVPRQPRWVHIPPSLLGILFVCFSLTRALCRVVCAQSSPALRCASPHRGSPHILPLRAR